MTRVGAGVARNSVRRNCRCPARAPPSSFYHNDLRLLLLHLLRLLRLRTRLLHLLRHLLLHRHLPLLLRLRLIPLLLPVTLLRLPVIRLSSRLLRVVGLRRSRLLPVCGLLLKLSAVALLLSAELRLRLLRDPFCCPMPFCGCPMLGCGAFGCAL